MATSNPSSMSGSMYTIHAKVGRFGTGNAWKAVTQGGTNKGILSVGAADPSQHQVLLGLDMLDMGNSPENNTALRIKTSATNVTGCQFEINIDSWADTMLYNARVSWLKTAQMGAGGIQGGTVLVENSDKKQQKFVRTVSFPKSFAAKPLVFVGLNRFDVGHCWRINVFTENVTAKGFDVHVETWGNSELSSAGITYIAVPSNLASVSVGRFQGDRKSGNWRGSTPFSHPFHHTPAIFTALTKFDVNGDYNFRVRLNTSATKNGMDWHIESWYDTELFEVHGAYFAIEL